MDSTGDPSAIIPSVASYSSLGRRYTISTCQSEHLIAYLRRESVRSIISLEPAPELEEPKEESSGQFRPISSSDLWWPSSVDSALTDSNLFDPQSGPSHDPVSDEAPTPTTPHFNLATTRHRPPPLKLKPLGETRLNALLSNNDNTPTTLHATEHALDPPSPWFLLDAFPSPPSTVRRSKTSISLSRILRRGGSNSPGAFVPDSPKYWPKGRERGQDENSPPMRPSRHGKKGRASFGSLGKAFRIAPDPVPSTPPLPTSRRRSKSISSKPNLEPRALTNWNARDSFASKLFTLASSPIAETGGSHERKAPTRPKALYIPRNDIRMVSCPVRGPITLDTETQSATSRSRSASQPNQSKARGKRTEAAYERRDNLLFVEPETPLVVPPRRTRSPSYINLYVPPWRQTTISPTQTSFAAIGTLISAPSTPTDAVFDIPRFMHLPASKSARSVRVGVDPFGAGEPSSFFRFEYEDDRTRCDDVDQDTTYFYGTIRAEVKLKKETRRKPSRRAVTPHTVPEIIVSSSRGLNETIEKNAVLMC
ncbi:hypothetical protein BDV93DRAFT_582777 [Ceratobasidium sp. AG-I]|nr:hypothetical protein BDV93DRAFT_582777 [Ceratobasidium sp. AG-I]